MTSVFYGFLEKRKECVIITPVKYSKKKRILIIAAAALLAVGGILYFFVFKNKAPVYDFNPVSTSDVDIKNKLLFSHNNDSAKKQYCAYSEGEINNFFVAKN